MRTVKLTLVFFLLACLPLTSAFAGGAKSFLGLGIGWAPDYEGSDDYEVVPVPYARVTWDSGRYLLLNGGSLRANLLADKALQLGPILQYRRERDDVEDSRVKEMDKVDGSVEAGGFLAYRANSFLVGLDAVADISGGHDGYLVTLCGAYSFDKFPDGSNIVPFIATTYADDNYMESYFQVDHGNVGSSGLPFYKAGSGFKDVQLGVNSDMDVSDDLIIRATLVYTKLLNDAKDSPVVKDAGDDNQFFIGLVGVYKFNR